MRCSYCIQEAEFKCGCQQAYMCGAHFKTHIKILNKHEFEELDISIETPRLQRLKSEAFIKIQKIKEAEKMIASTTKLLIKTIEKAHKEAIKRLDILRKRYFEILDQKMFCISELPIIEKIETMVLLVKTVEIDKINSQIGEAYEGELVYYLEKEKIRKEDEERRKKEEERRIKVEEEKEVDRHKKEEEKIRRKKEEERSNSYIEISLKQKIDYYYPIVLNKIPWLDGLNGCHLYGKELLVSNDGKYLFFCKLHSGIGYQDCI